MPLCAGHGTTTANGHAPFLACPSCRCWSLKPPLRWSLPWLEIGMQSIKWCLHGQVHLDKCDLRHWIHTHHYTLSYSDMATRILTQELSASGWKNQIDHRRMRCFAKAMICLVQMRMCIDNKLVSTANTFQLSQIFKLITTPSTVLKSVLLIRLYSC